ncbi:hypothetical protein AX17_006439 [Amanita inopinata Kibby_2008]|nr:hypothetical protein AX17_006439 [Amanita inopinata Kibby_2008]
MSRVPQLQRSSSRPSLRTPTTPSKQRVTPANTPTKPGSSSVKPRAPVHLRSPAKSNGSRNKVVDDQPAKSAPLSIKEVIALKRAEAKKLQSKSSHSALGSLGGGEDAPSATPEISAPDEDSMGRLSLRQTIERARSTGSINIATRSLPCLPSALFEIHLGVTPESLKSVPNEPPLPPPSSVELQSATRRNTNPSWFEAQDLQVLKAWNNEIVEIQHEISLFGSLKTVDLHQNKLTSLPDSFADLMSLTTLDLSHNELTCLPENLFSLPELMNLNISHNKLTALRFNAPFPANGSTVRRVSANFFSMAIERASSPLPRLHNLDASYNEISASSIDPRIPSSLTKLNLCGNPLDGDNGSCQSLVQALAGLSHLTELRLEKAGIGDAAFPASLSSSSAFPRLRLMDLGETKVTLDAMKVALKGMKQMVDYNYTTEEPPVGVCRVVVGKKMFKEAWEIELEKQAKQKSLRVRDLNASQDWTESPGLFGPPTGATQSQPRKKEVVVMAKKVVAKKEVVKESWEIEAEQGLLTEGAKRRARAVAASEEQKVLGHGKQPSNSSVSSSSTIPAQNQTVTLANPKYYSEATLTLTLPPCAPPTKAAGHARAFSLAAPSLSGIASKAGPGRATDIAIPAPTLPLSVIVTQPFANSLRSLILINRRMDRCFSLPEGGPEENLLPNLEELNLENCNLPDMISVARSSLGSEFASAPRTNESIIPLITKLFPNLQTLNLSYNALNGFFQNTETLSSLILATGVRRGLKHLRLRGNGIKDLEGLKGVASMFKGFREVPGWKLDELDIRDNDVEKLLPELGLLPLDVFLVDGNAFRVPQRRVWEREGTKGLLSWLRGRIE